MKNLKLFLYDRLLWSLLLYGLCCGSLFAKDYYWVGDNGNWGDIRNWRLGSGSSNQAKVIPSSNDNVIFDAKSFSTNSPKIFIELKQAYCNNVIFKSGKSQITFELSSSSVWSIQGEVKVEDDIDFKLKGSLRFTNSEAKKTVDFNREISCKKISFSGVKSIWNWKHGFESNDITFSDGSLVLSGINITTSQFLVDAKRQVHLDISGSKLRLINKNEKLPVFQANSDFLELKAANSQMVLGGLNPIFKISGKKTTRFGQIKTTGVTSKIYFKGDGSSSFKASTIELARENELIGNFDCKNLVLAKGTTLEIKGSIAMQALKAKGNCEQRINIFGNGPSGSSVMRSTTSQEVTYTNIRDIHAEGQFKATKSASIGDNKGWTFIDEAKYDLYWVGGAGNWSDPNHWSFESGGSGGACVPSLADNVFFDAKSFLGNEDQVKIDVDRSSCHNMTWKDVKGKPQLLGEFYQILQITGSLHFDGSVSNRFEGDIEFYSTEIGNTITLNQVYLNQNIVFKGRGGWLLEDELKVLRTIGFEGGTFHSKNQTIRCTNFDVRSGKKELDLGKSKIYIDLLTKGIGICSVAFDASDLILKAKESTFLFENRAKLFLPYDPANQNYSKYVHIGTIVTKNKKTDINKGKGQSIFKIDSLKSYYDLLINENCQIGYAYFNPGNTYDIGPDLTIDIANLDASGNCDRMVTIQSNAVKSAAITLDKSYRLDYLQLADIEIKGGKLFRVEQSINLGGNKNIDFSLRESRKLYWVGGPGKWSDRSHWSLTSGGVGGECIPTAVDHVVVDEKSYWNSNKSLWISDALTSNYYCKEFTWKADLIGVVRILHLHTFGQISINKTFSKKSTLTMHLRGSEDKIRFSAPGRFIKYLTLNSRAGSYHFDSSFDAYIVNGIQGNFNWKSSSHTFDRWYNYGAKDLTLNLGRSSFTIKSIPKSASNDFSTSTTTYVRGENAELFFKGVTAKATVKGPFKLGKVILDPSGKQSFWSDLNVSGSTIISKFQSKSSTNFYGFFNIDSLILSPGQTYKLEKNKEFQVNKYLVLWANNCLKSSLRSSQPGIMATLNLQNVDTKIEFVEMQNIAAKNVVPVSAGIYSTNIGKSNTGWTFGANNKQESKYGVLGPDIFACKESEIELNKNNFLGGRDFRWGGPNVTDKNNNVPNLKIDKSGLYSVEVQYTDNCILNDTVKIILNDFNLDIGPDRNICHGDIVDISPLPIDGATYEWYDGQRKIDDLKIEKTGNYIVKATIEGCVFEDSLKVTVEDYPPKLLDHYYEICDKDSLVIDLPVSYSYKWGNSMQESKRVFYKSGKHMVQISNRHCSKMDSMEIMVHPLPAPPSDLNILACHGQKIVVDMDTLQANIRWEDNSTERVRTFWPLASKKMGFRLDNGCIADYEFAFNYVPPSPVELPSEVSLCHGDSLSLSIQTPLDSLLWSTGEKSKEIILHDPNLYYVTTFKDGCPNKHSIRLTTTKLDIPELPRDTTLCDGQVLSFFRPMATESFNWDGKILGDSLLVDQPGSYNLKAVKGPCKIDKNIIVDYLPIPDIDLGRDTTLCPGEKMSIGYEGYYSAVSWNDGLSVNKRTISEAGTYVLEVDMGGCKSQDAIEIKYVPDWEFDLGKDTTVCLDRAGFKLAVPSLADKYIWHDGSTKNYIQLYEDTYVTLQVERQGCIKKDSLHVAFEQCEFEVAFPNVFTPDGNGDNDLFEYFLNGDPDKVQHIEMNVFDRWGNKVFSTDKLFHYWDGLINDRKGENGIFVYTLNLTYISLKGLEKRSFRGDVLLAN